jgi:hypothetical protein
MSLHKEIKFEDEICEHLSASDLAPLTESIRRV